MEIELSALLGQDLSNTYGSQHTHGENSAATTWEAAKTVVLPLTNSELSGIYKHLKEIGVSDVTRDETELRAYLIQLIQADLLESGLDDLSDLEHHQSESYESGRLFWGTDGKPYYQL